MDHEVNGVTRDTLILIELAKNPQLTQREIARKSQISLGKANYALRALIAKGYIKVINFKDSKNKSKYLYLLTPQGMYEKARLTADFLAWKMEEYERLKREIDELNKTLGT